MKNYGNQWVKMKNKIILSALILASFGILINILGMIQIKSPHSNCIKLYVDFNILSERDPSTNCLNESNTIQATDLLIKEQYAIIGTNKYPSQVVCRVDMLPAPSQEPCSNMPSADRYWAILIERNSKWDYAKAGIADIKLKPGEGLALVFTIKGKTRFPPNS